MNKPNRLNRGDKVAIVSLSSGIMGESFIKFEVDLGVKRLQDMGLTPVFMNNSLKGLDFLKNHPEARADDLKQAFADNEIKAIICAIGGDDTYRTLPYLLEDETFIENVKHNPKIFLGYSDTTTNHFMFHKLGLNTFYGQAFLTDLAEFEPDMLPYSKEAFEYLFNPTDNHEIKPSPVWYEDRKDFSQAAVGTLREKHTDLKGYELLQGTGKVQGELLGGCIEIFGYFTHIEDFGYFNESEKFNENLDKNILNKYNVFPTLEDWSGKIMLIETSEAKMNPEKFRGYIRQLKELRIFDRINGLIVGKPIDERYYNEYNHVLKSELSGYKFPILTNINVGHAYPHTIIPFGAVAEIDCEKRSLTLLNSTLN